MIKPDLDPFRRPGGTALRDALLRLRPMPGAGPSRGASPGPIMPAVRAALERLSALRPAPGLCGMAPAASAAPAVPAGASFDEVAFRGSDGSIGGRLYVPGGRVRDTMPLVVMLHGCTQSPEDFAAGTRMNEVAEAEGLLVLYPRQTRSNNAQKCWNWFDPKDQGRGRGEPALIAGLARQVLRDHPADPARVYVAGLSAGGAAAAILAQNYPDLFAAAGVHSGLARGAASDVVSAFAAMRGGGPAHGHAAARRMPTIVFHGDADRTVHPSNAERVAEQAAAGAALAVETGGGRAAGGLGYTRRIAHGPDGAAAVESWTLHGAGHAWSGGSTAGSYTEPRGPDASREMLRFFLGHALRPPAA